MSMTRHVAEIAEWREGGRWGYGCQWWSGETVIGHVYGGIEARATSPADCANVWRSTDSQASNCIFKVYLFLD